MMEKALSPDPKSPARDHQAAALLGHHLGLAPAWAVVLGSGLGVLRARLQDARSVGHAELGLPVPGIVGHQGELASGQLDGSPVALVSGRVHLYEGHAPADVVAYVRALRQWGVKAIAFTNAAGSLHRDWLPGSLMRLVDHIDLSGGNPLVGPNRGDLGPRFPDLTQAYDPALGARADALAVQDGTPLQKGVYVAMRGPSYETPAEVRMLGLLGADVVGMSTVPEVIAATHCGLRVVAFSVISNLGCGLSDEPADHEAVTRVVGGAAEPLARLIARLVAEPV